MQLPNLPVFLTLFRLIGAPSILPASLIFYLPTDFFLTKFLLALLFVLFSITDFLDGYFARKFDQETTIGSVLDPIADKFLLFSTLIGLLVVGHVWFFWVILFIAREFFVVGLRSIAYEYGFRLSVSPMAKIKTFFQIVYMTILILKPLSFGVVAGFSIFSVIEVAALLFALFLSLGSAYEYYYYFAVEYGRKIGE